MKIAFLHMTMGLISRGSEISTDLIASELSTKHRVQVYMAGKMPKTKYSLINIPTIKDAPTVAPYSLLNKLKFRLYIDENSLEVVKFTKACVSKLNKFKPDLIITTNGAPQLKIIKKAFPKIKTAVFGRAGIGHDDQGNINQQPDLFIALSEEARKWAKKIAKKATKVVHIPNPIDISMFDQSEPSITSIDGFTVVTVSAFTKYKNIDTVIRAVASTKHNLIIVGHGELEKDLKKLANDHLKKRHMFMINVKPEDLPGIYKSAQCLCFVPDSQESFGRVYLEAMAAKLPIVATDDSTRQAIIGAEGFFVDNKDVHAVTQSINTAVEYGNVDYSKQLKKFDLRTVIKNLNEEINELKK